MINLFLRAKHWQIFVLTFVLPLAVHIGFMVYIFSKMIYTVQPNPQEFIGFFYYIPFISFLFMGLLFGWYYSLTIGLQNKLPSGMIMKVNRFKIFMAIPFIYILAISMFLTSILSAVSAEGVPDFSMVGIFMLLVIPLHFFSIFCIIYIMYFTAKTIKSVELQRRAEFSDYIGEFFLLWFSFIGVWFIQPKVNKFLNNRNTYSDDDILA